MVLDMSEKKRLSQKLLSDIISPNTIVTTTRRRKRERQNRK
jgi:hypothetical protein